MRGFLIILTPQLIEALWVLTDRTGRGRTFPTINIPAVHTDPERIFAFTKDGILFYVFGKRAKAVIMMLFDGSDTAE